MLTGPSPSDDLVTSTLDARRRASSVGAALAVAEVLVRVVLLVVRAALTIPYLVSSTYMVIVTRRPA